jgi:hypothetical protein
VQLETLAAVDWGLCWEPLPVLQWLLQLVVLVLLSMVSVEQR